MTRRQLVRQRLHRPKFFLHTRIKIVVVDPHFGHQLAILSLGRTNRLFDRPFPILKGSFGNFEIHVEFAGRSTGFSCVFRSRKRYGLDWLQYSTNYRFLTPFTFTCVDVEMYDIAILLKYKAFSHLSIKCRLFLHQQRRSRFVFLGQTPPFSTSSRLTRERQTLL